MKDILEFAYGAFSRISDPWTGDKQPWTLPTAGWSFASDDVEDFGENSVDHQPCQFCWKQKHRFGFRIGHPSVQHTYRVGGCCAIKLGCDASGVGQRIRASLFLKALQRSDWDVRIPNLCRVRVLDDNTFVLSRGRTTLCASQPYATREQAGQAACIIAHQLTPIPPKPKKEEEAPF